MTQAIVNGVFVAGIYATVALGLSLIFGVLGLANLAHGELVMAGAYLSFLVIGWVDVDPLITLVVVAPVMFGAGYVLHRAFLARLMVRSGEAALVATFGIGLLLQGVFSEAASANLKTLPASYATTGVSIFGTQVRTVYVIAFGCAVFLTTVTYLVLHRTRLGLAVRAAVADPDTAATMGVNVRSVHAITFGAGAALAALGGILIGEAFSFSPTAGTTWLLLAFAVVALGGIGNVWGTLVAAIAVGVVQGVGGDLFGGAYTNVVVYIMFFVVLVIRPAGLFRPVT
jgi:branched-chain amino acid transport system permease protein